MEVLAKPKPSARDAAGKRKLSLRNVTGGGHAFASGGKKLQV